MSRKPYTTVEVAKAEGVPRATLQHWIKTGKIAAPRVRLVDGKAVRLWTEDQVKQVRRLKRWYAAARKAWAKVRARKIAALKKALSRPAVRAQMRSAAKNASEARRRSQSC